MFSNKKLFLTLTLIFLAITILIGGAFYYLKKPKLTELEKQGTIGDYILTKDFQQKPILPIKQTDTNYQLTDSLINGPTITYANPPEGQENKPKNELNIEFPKNYPEPINIKLDEQRVITIKDNTGVKYNSKLIEENLPLEMNNDSRIMNQEFPEQEPLNPEHLEQGHDKTLEQSQQLEQLQHLQQSQHASYLKYQSKDKRISTYYAYQKANNQRTLKHWTIYSKPNKDQEEKESYQISNAKLKLNNQGEVEVYYFGEQELKNEEVKAQVDSNLMARAQRTLQKELGEDILNTNNHTPDFIIPAPYYITKNQERKTLSWELNQETNTINLSFKPQKEEYPIGLDPTIEFAAPGQAGSSDVISMIPSNSWIGYPSLLSSDLNNDGREDLVVSSEWYNGSTGRVYIFYNDGSIPTTVANADTIISGEFFNMYFGSALATGDLNNDGKKDLIVGSFGQTNSYSGAYIFYNDGTYSTLARDADIIIDGGEEDVGLGNSIACGDLDYDGDEDLIIGASSTWYRGRVYIFYNDGSISNSIEGADLVIWGDDDNLDDFGEVVTINDFNNDSRLDLAVSNGWNIYLFYNDGMYSNSFSGADLIISPESGGLNSIFVIGDVNNDSILDFALESPYYSSSTGRVYIIYNDGSIPTAAASADIIITGQATSNYFGMCIENVDLNNDSKKDLIVGANGYSTSTGRTYIFYNDGSIPTAAASADIIITGQATNNYLGMSIVLSDINNDSKKDLIIGSYGYSYGCGRIYVFYNDGSIPTGAGSADIFITGDISAGSFGNSMIKADFNNDGKDDLIVGASGEYSNFGRVYIFYNDGAPPSNESGADIIITGESTASNFGFLVNCGDLNNDGKKDLIVSSITYNSNTGRIYIFYNDGTIPTTAVTADVIITGEGSNNYFSRSVVCGDFNADGRIDLAAGASGYTSNTGRVYIFYNDGTIPTTAATADVIITGEGSNNYFGSKITEGDLNSDGKNDLISGAYNYSSGTGRVYIFYNDGTIPTTAATADLKIAGQGGVFGLFMITGDFNSDSRTDLVISAPERSTSGTNGWVYLFYNDGSIPTTAATADVIIQGIGTNNDLGRCLLGMDFNNDGKNDLIVRKEENGGKALVFYNDGSYPSTDIQADAAITAEITNSNFATSLIDGDFNLDGKNDLVIGSPGYSSGRIYIFYNQVGQLAYSNNAEDSNAINITGIGEKMLSGDFNNDGKIDLVIGTPYYSSNTGRVYIFYNDGSLPEYAILADVIMDGETTSTAFGSSLNCGDFNHDGKNDLSVGAYAYNSYVGRAYVFYNDSTYPTNASGADVIINGGVANDYFGSAITNVDFNSDGREDLAIGAYGYLTRTGRVYIFYNDGSYPSSVSGADIVITGESTNSYFGSDIIAGDIGGGIGDDLVVFSDNYSSSTGRLYIFYNDGSIPTTAVSADLIITGGSTYTYFAAAVALGDFDNSGTIDLAVGVRNVFQPGEVYVFYNDGSIPTISTNADVIIEGNNSDSMGAVILSYDFNGDGTTDIVAGTYEPFNTGKVFVFYNDGVYPASSASADVSIMGGSESLFGYAMASGDFDSDSKVDLAVGAEVDNNVYIFYNDGSYPTTSDTADFTISGSVYGNYFGTAMTSGDFNNDSKTDLAVGAYGHTAGFGKVYLFYNDGSMPTTPETADVIISGETQESWFGSTLSSGDLNSDNQTDLIIGAKGYSTNKGRVYIIYNDGSYPSLAENADIKIDGENNNDNFGYSITTGDIIGDSKTDLIIGATGYSTNTGRTYIINNDGSISTLAANSDIKIDGQNSNDNFGISLITGDFDYDMDNDLVVGSNYNTNTGRAYIFNNDGSYPTLAANSDIKIDGELANNYFSNSFTKGDFNNDNRIDLVIGAYGYSNNTGRVYIFNNDGTIPTTAVTADNIITGEFIESNFGYSLASGDFNTDNKIDLAVGANKFSYQKGNVYILYNDGSYPTVANNAEVSFGGAMYYDQFGIAILSGDFDGNNRVDLCIGKIGYNNIGGFYVYTTDAEGTRSSDTHIRGEGGILNGRMIVR